MDIKNINSQLINWDKISGTETKGEKGINISKVIELNDTRIRLSKYSVNYVTSEWCSKGHIIHCIEGELNILLKSGNNIMLTEGKSAVLRDGDQHKGATGDKPATIFIVD